MMEPGRWVVCSLTNKKSVRLGPTANHGRHDSDKSSHDWRREILLARHGAHVTLLLFIPRQKKKLWRAGVIGLFRVVPKSDWQVNASDWSIFMPDSASTHDEAGSIGHSRDDCVVAGHRDTLPGCNTAINRVCVSAACAFACSSRAVIVASIAPSDVARGILK